MLKEKLRFLRKTFNYTQQEIASALNMNRSTYTYYETGKSIPPIRVIVAVAGLFKVSTDYLLIDEIAPCDYQKHKSKHK